MWPHARCVVGGGGREARREALKRRAPAPWRVRPSRLVPFALLVGAAIVQLPLVYTLVERRDAAPPVALGVGLLSMGLAWSAGCSLEDRRKGTVRAISLAGALAPWLAFVPSFPVDFAPWERLLLAACSLLSAAGLALLWRRWR